MRGPISLVPRDLNGQPVQLTAKKLAKIPFGLGDWLGSQIRKIYFGNVEKHGLAISKMHPAVQLRETGKTPVIDIGTITAIKAGKIKVLKDIRSFTKTGVITVDEKEIAIDKFFNCHLSQIIANAIRDTSLFELTVEIKTSKK